jgi:hypothetical protein
VCEKGLGQYDDRDRYNKFKEDTLKIVTLNLKLKNYKISDNTLNRNCCTQKRTLVGMGDITQG